VLWITYGISNNLMPIIIGDSIALALSSIILFYKIKEK
jgi:uncharacterized protein with PQ loop repeat